MHLVVTVPKSELRNLAREDAWAVGKDVVQYWSVHRRPKKLNSGDRVYFVENGAVRYYQEFLGFIENPICEVTGRVWPGLNLILKYPEVKIEPIPMKGFQGFRYMP